MTRDAWPHVLDAVSRATVPATIRPRRATGFASADLGFTSASFLGAMIDRCGGIEVDYGWLRLLGGDGDDDVPSVRDANISAAGLFVVAYDVLGGVFALDGGALGEGRGSVHYFGPDTLDWQDLEMGHADLVVGMLDGASTQFYGPLRWAGWQEEVRALAPTEGIAAYPPLFTVEGSDPAACHRRAVPFAELIAFDNDAAQQLNGAAAGPPIPELRAGA